MSTSNVSRLADYRSGRAKRSEQTAALYRGDPARSCLLGHLASAQELVGADRASVVWIDEYGPGLVHVHCLLDLVGNPPRRDFAIQACRVAWGKGVPGLLDLPDVERAGEIRISGVRSSCCVAMGSDGTRAWFLIVDSLTPRPRLAVEVTDELMFLAGEAAAVVLHQDLGRKTAGPRRLRKGAGPEAGETFSGWAILKDLEGREADAETNRRIATRFLVARAVQSALDEELTLDPEADPTMNIGVVNFKERSMTVQYAAQAVFPGLFRLVQEGRHDPHLLNPVRVTAVDECSVTPGLDGWRALGCLEFQPGSLWSGADGG